MYKHKILNYHQQHRSASSPLPPSICDIRRRAWFWEVGDTRGFLQQQPSTQAFWRAKKKKSNQKCCKWQSPVRLTWNPAVCFRWGRCKKKPKQKHNKQTSGSLSQSINWLNKQDNLHTVVKLKFLYACKKKNNNKRFRGCEQCFKVRSTASGLGEEVWGKYDFSSEAWRKSNLKFSSCCLSCPSVRRYAVTVKMTLCCYHLKIHVNICKTD